MNWKIAFWIFAFIIYTLTVFAASFGAGFITRDRYPSYQIETYNNNVIDDFKPSVAKERGRGR